MLIYIVEREGDDGLETDCFIDRELAQEWADWIGGRVRNEPVISRGILDDMKDDTDNYIGTGIKEDPC